MTPLNRPAMPDRVTARNAAMMRGWMSAQLGAESTATAERNNENC